MAVKAIYVFQNSMVMAFDEQGQQIPELQGPLNKVKDAVLEAADEHTSFNNSAFKEWNESISKRTFANMERSLPSINP